MIKLIGTDIDGTLLDSHWQVPDGNRAAVARAVDLGIEVALATGRRFDFARPIADMLLPTPLTLIVNNGAVIKTQSGETILRHLLPKDITRIVLERTREFRDEAAVVFDRPRAEQVIYERIDWDHPRRGAYARRSREFVAEVQPLEACLTEDPIQVMFSGGVDQMRRLLQVLAQPDIAPSYSLAVTEYAARDLVLVDVIPKGCSKGAGLAELAARRGITREQVMAVGDNLNDLDMLEYAGCPVVMGNAIQELKAYGWPVTATNDEGGLGQAIERFALNPI